jgi:hypothetical protein
MSGLRGISPFLRLRSANGAVFLQLNLNNSQYFPGFGFCVIRPGNVSSDLIDDKNWTKMHFRECRQEDQPDYQETLEERLCRDRFLDRRYD